MAETGIFPSHTHCVLKRAGRYHVYIRFGPLRQCIRRTSHSSIVHGRKSSAQAIENTTKESIRFRGWRLRGFFVQEGIRKKLRGLYRVVAPPVCKSTDARANAISFQAMNKHSGRGGDLSLSHLGQGQVRQARESAAFSPNSLDNYSLARLESRMCASGSIFSSFHRRAKYA
ncbi:MAG: hypothetical protein FE78DRAFT_430434 [Acidomyces sp. 'richmondensis']|nr:MAG: hypothetical protein FE78DRAFT_430434 [Acidomyces sp. 'richmondensis']